MLLLEQLPDMEVKLNLMNNYPVKNFVDNIIADAMNEDSKYNRFCKVEYKGKSISNCGFTLALALAKVKPFMEEEVSTHYRDWKWSNIHYNDYKNMPWSRIPILQYFFDRFQTNHSPNNASWCIVRAVCSAQSRK